MASTRASEDSRRDGDGLTHDVDGTMIEAEPTINSPRKQISLSAPTTSVQSFSDHHAGSSGRSIPLGHVEASLLTNQGSGADLNFDSIGHYINAPLSSRNLKDPATLSPSESWTRVKNGVMPNLLPPSKAWAATANETNPADTPPLSAHVSVRIESTTGESAMECSDIHTEALGRPTRLHVTPEEGDGKITTPSDLLWQQIQRLRVDNWSLRSEIHEKRAELRAQKNHKTIAEDVLFQRFRKQLLLGCNAEIDSPLHDAKSIAELMEEYQALRDDYGPLEDECNNLEDELTGQEFQLARKENEFYRRSGGTQNIYENAGIPANDTNSRHPETTGTPGVSPEEMRNLEHHPLVPIFLSKLGEFEILCEQFEDLDYEQEALQEEKLTRERTGRVLDSHDQDTLDNWKAVKDEMTTKIRVLEIEVERMRQECLSKSLIDEYDDPTNFESRERASFRGEDNIDAQDHISEYVKHPLLLPHPGINKGVSWQSAFEPGEKTGNSSGRVNLWLLDRLRTSALDVRLLASTFEEEGGKTDDEWEVLVLEVWYNDGTSMRPGFRVYSSSSSTYASPPSNISYATIV
ncbi:hypothetical protein G7Y89_g9302 [Cudoniella acicularis]|uniref:Uncharacterized protein n=1 Tax=Cudoniella acicularis TaxID=354080 RepID=A0A8H4RGG1_9HELO|nr:hypothetical protein G7Y89_g9302 [Cudoniella acicularis]